MSSAGWSEILVRCAYVFFFQAEDGIRDRNVTGVQTCALPISFVKPPWTLPAPIGAYLATGGDWRAIVLVIINIFISVGIYLPFFKIYDRKMLRSEERRVGKECRSLWSP